MVIWFIFPIPHESCSNDRTDVDFIVELQPFGITWITKHQYSDQLILYAAYTMPIDSGVWNRHPIDSLEKLKGFKR